MCIACTWYDVQSSVGGALSPLDSNEKRENLITSSYIWRQWETLYTLLCTAFSVHSNNKHVSSKEKNKKKIIIHFQCARDCSLVWFRWSHSIFQFQGSSTTIWHCSQAFFVSTTWTGNRKISQRKWHVDDDDVTAGECVRSPNESQKKVLTVQEKFVFFIFVFCFLVSQFATENSAHIKIEYNLRDIAFGDVLMMLVFRWQNSPAKMVSIG